MNFKTITIIKHPIDCVWVSMRDDLPKIVHLLEDIESIDVELYEKKSHICKIINIWKASPPLPASLTKLLDSDMFVWTDRAEWNEKKQACSWDIELHHFRDKLQCSGSTIFTEAMGGKGTRIVFSGCIEWNYQSFSGFPIFLDDAVRNVVESFISKLIPKNFRKITEALTNHIEACLQV